MPHAKEMSLVLLAAALGCGGKVMDVPGYGPVGEDGSVLGEDASTSGSSGGSGSSGSSGGPTTGSSSGSSGGGPCGGARCSSGEVCCVSVGAAGGGDAGAAEKCSTKAACSGGLALSCGSASDCSGKDVCCLSLSLGGALGGLGGGGGVSFSGSSTCTASCGTGMCQLCTTNAECPGGMACTNTGMGGSVCGSITSCLGLGGGLGGLGGLGGGGTAGNLGGILCAHPDTPIATPGGERPIASLEPGDLVLSVDHGHVRPVPLLRVNRSPAPHHHVVQAVLENGRTLRISEGHPTADGRLFRDLVPGDRLGDVPVVSLESIPYDADATYDILPASDTGTYFAAGALIGSTLFH